MDYFGEFCNAGIYVYDDCSTDNTVAICKQHPAVGKVIEGKTWWQGSSRRKKAEGKLRQKVYQVALQHNPEWFFYFDADERPEFDWENFNYGKWDAVRFKLFDYYITPEDIDLLWYQRKWLGPEFRYIMMMFRNVPGIKFNCRQPRIPENSRITEAGYVRHYGKAISIEHWDRACAYYINHRFTTGILNQRWKERIGKAVHIDMLSDYGLPLIQWHEKDEKGIRLQKRIDVLRARGVEI